MPCDKCEAVPHGPPNRLGSLLFPFPCGQLPPQRSRCPHLGRLGQAPAAVAKPQRFTRPEDPDFLWSAHRDPAPARERELASRMGLDADPDFPWVKHRTPEPMRPADLLDEIIGNPSSRAAHEAQKRDAVQKLRGRAPKPKRTSPSMYPELDAYMRKLNREDAALRRGRDATYNWRSGSDSHSFTATHRELDLLYPLYDGDKGAAVRNARLRDTRVTASRFDQADLRGLRLENSHWDNINARDARFDGAQFKNTVLQDVRAQGSQWNRVDLSQDVLFAGVDASNGSFRGAKLQGLETRRGSQGQATSFRRADMQGADLRNARLNDVDFSGANLGGVDLTGANLAGANVDRSTKLRGVLLDDGQRTYVLD